jgi:hypothetical protein
MATLILVHGTFVSGPEEGDQWWQRGSAFDAHLHELITAETGDLAVERFVWDGNNSVSSRRAAGKALHRRMIELEKADESYCLVGHSHGGSVIAAALMLAAIARRPLQHLRRWITVGTPFIVPQKDRFLFSRLEHLGKAVLVAITTFAFCAVLASFSSFDDAGAIATAVFAVAIMPFLLVYLTLWLIDRRRNGHFRPRVLARFDKTFAARWLGLWHKDDEAIGGLVALGHADRSIFGKQFAVPVLSMLALVVFPVLVYAVLSSPDLAQWLANHHLRTFGSEKLAGIVEGGALKGAGKNVGINFVLLLTTGGEAFKLIYPGSHSTARAAFLIGVVPITFLLLSLIILLLVTYAARPVSIVLSRLLNASTWAQFRQTGFGGDVQGEREVEARTAPVGFSMRFAALPDEIASELATVSDAGAAKSISRLRGAINKFAFAKGDGEKAALAEYLTWKELIHTCYFDVPGVRKLIAFAIAETDGFRASDSFQSDPDCTRVGAWYRMLEVANNPDGQQTPSQGTG